MEPEKMTPRDYAETDVQTKINEVIPMVTQEKIEQASTRDDAKEIIEEIFDDEADKQVITQKLNDIIDIPKVPEAMEGAIISQFLTAVVYVYNEAT